MKRTWHLVTYDIHDEHRLRRVAKLMEGYGERLQLSVFRCRLTPRTQAELLWKLAQITEDVDSLLVVPLCNSCTGDVIQRGPGREWAVEPPDYRVY